RGEGLLYVRLRAVAADGDPARGALPAHHFAHQVVAAPIWQTDITDEQVEFFLIAKPQRGAVRGGGRDVEAGQVQEARHRVDRVEMIIDQQNSARDPDHADIPGASVEGP